MTVETSNDNKSYLTRDEFINKLKANSLEIKNNEKKDFNERNKSRNNLKGEDIFSQYRENKVYGSVNSRSRGNYRSYNRNNFSRSNNKNASLNVAPIISAMFIVIVIFLKLVNIESFAAVRNNINDIISEVTPLEDMMASIDIFNKEGVKAGKLEDISFTESLENNENIENMSIEQLKTMTDFEIEEDLFSEKK